MISKIKVSNSKYLTGLVSKFKNVKVLVLGDLILDEFIWGSVSRISPEAPVPVVWVNSESFMPGGASNSSHNICSLGAKSYISGVIGNDDRGILLKKVLREKGVDVSGIVTDPSRPTILKSRVIAHSQQVVRIDREKIAAIDDKIINKIISFVKSKMSSVDAILINDYGKGLICPALLKEIISVAKKENKIITVDPKDDHFDFYKGVTAITPNHYEAGKAVGISIKTDDDLVKAGKKLLSWLQLECVLITLGERGMCLFDKDGTITRIPTMAQEVFDVSGAGDTVISTFTLCASLGAKFKDAAYVANYAAAVVVGKVGVAVVTPDELKARLKG